MTQIKDAPAKATVPQAKKQITVPLNPVTFFGNIKEEFRKIAWMPKDELLSHTKIVMITTFVLGALIFCMDLFIKGTLMTFSTIMRWITS